MPAQGDSWTKKYDQVDFDLPYLSSQLAGSPSLHEREHMLSRPESESPTPTPLPSEASPRIPKVHKLYSQSPPYTPYTPVTESSRSSSEPHPESSTSRPPLRSSSFASSPLNPTSAPLSPFARPGSRGSARVARIPSEETRALSMASLHPWSNSIVGSRGSMVLYRRVEDDEALAPPSFSRNNRDSAVSESGDSIMSLSSDSKYPAGMMLPERGLVAYAYDPTLDEQEPTNDEDLLHDPTEKSIRVGGSMIPWRGITNIAALVLLIAALLCLFVLYPIVAFYNDTGRDAFILGNTRINATGQAVGRDFDSRSQIPLSLIPGNYLDPMTPRSATFRKGLDGAEYELVFSDEFEVDGRTFLKDDDPFWEADDWESYTPEQLTTANGHLVVRVDSPPSRTDHDRAEYVGGLLRNQMPFCLSQGFVEVGLVLPGRDTKAYWSGGWSIAAPGVDVSGFVPSGPSLHKELKFMLNLGVIAENLGRPTAAMYTPTSVLVDYVRFYQHKNHSAIPCDSSVAEALEAVDTVLDVYSLIP